MSAVVAIRIYDLFPIAIGNDLHFEAANVKENRH
jgi:hypothetical protein